MCPSASASNRIKKKKNPMKMKVHNSIFFVKSLLFKLLWYEVMHILPRRIACGFIRAKEDYIWWKWLLSLTIEKAVLQIIFVFVQYSCQTVNIIDCKLIGKLWLCYKNSVKRERWVLNEDECWHRGFEKFSEAFALWKRHRSQIHSCCSALNLKGPWHQGWIWPTYQNNSIFILL